MNHPLLRCCTHDAVPEAEREKLRALAAQHRAREPAFAEWAAGYGVIRHDDLTQVRVHAMVAELVAAGSLHEPSVGYRRLVAADRIASAGMWLVVHMTYAREVRLDGAPLGARQFKQAPEGHTGGSLNMVPAYTAYLALNALDGHTRSWMMGQGHCVAAIDALNVIVGNMTEAHAARYRLDDEGLSQLVSDFYSYAIGPDGNPEAPLGSHVNAHTAGGTQEGGYLGFTELHYVHAPLPGERLVAFLSDGAFEEQRGSDWAPRWWRPEDSGLVTPIMILNGRRIEQRTLVDQQGGESWLQQHLELNGFEPVGLDGRDPASIAWGIHFMEARALEGVAVTVEGDGTVRPLHYGTAETVKGYGFPGAGTNRAHNLPLPGNPSSDEAARHLFNDAAHELYVAYDDLLDAVRVLSTHESQRRPLERDHPLAVRMVPSPAIPAPNWEAPTGTSSPMAALDRQFCTIVAANPQLRPRVGNPDELRSNRVDRTLDLLKHRVHHPEPNVAESTTGGVITALNEEAVVCAALGNKGGINLVVTYEAFGPKMLGALRQEITFSRQLQHAGRPPGWIAVPVVLTSHTWENAKNEYSHQDPTLAETLLGEMADAASVVFPADSNSTIAALSHVYRQHGRVVAMVVPKRSVASVFTGEQAQWLAEHGSLLVAGNPADARAIIAAVGAYQLAAALKARQRLLDRSIDAALVYLSEPGRFRHPRDAQEASHVLGDDEIHALFPPGTPQVLITHTRPEPMLGLLRRIDTGPKTTRALGYINRGGTLDVDGLLFANRCTWAHVTAAAAEVCGESIHSVLDEAEREAVEGRGSPQCLWA